MKNNNLAETNEDIKKVAGELFNNIIVEKAEPLPLKTAREIIASYISLGRNGVIGLKEGFKNLTNAKQIGVYLVAKRVMNTLGFMDSEKATESEIAINLNIPVGTVRTSLQRALKKFVSNKRGYFITDSKLNQFRMYLFQDNKNERIQKPIS